MAILVVLFIVVPIAELYVIIQVGGLIGVWPTLALLLAGSLLGSWMLRHQGRSAWRNFNEALNQRRFPGREVADGALIVVGGTLLLTPGFITDAVGLLLLFPPTRAIARAGLRRFFVGRFTVIGMPGRGRGPFGPGGGGGGPFGPDRPGGANRDYDFDAGAEEVPSNGHHEGRELPRIDDDR